MPASATETPAGAQVGMGVGVAVAAGQGAAVPQSVLVAATGHTLPPHADTCRVRRATSSTEGGAA